MLEHKTKDLSNPVEVHEELLALLKTYPSLHRIVCSSIEVFVNKAVTQYVVLK